MQHIEDVMSHNVEVIGPAATLREATEKMRARRVGALPVCQGGELVGIITDRDIAVRATADGYDPANTAVRNFMTPDPVTCYEDGTIPQAAKLMVDHQIRRLPVLSRNERMVGILTLDDLAVDTGDEEMAGLTLEQVAVRKPQQAFERIVVALDGSARGEEVLPAVEQIAKKFDSTVTLLCVIDPLDVPSEVGAGVNGTLESRIVNRDAIRITKDMRSDPISYLNAVSHGLVFRGVRVEVEHPQASHPAAAIVRRARHLGASLIAMSTHARSPLGHIVFGSVADEVLRTSTCPVLLVKAQQKAPDHQGGKP